MLTENDRRRYDDDWTADGVIGDGMAGDEAIAAFLAWAPDQAEHGVALTRRELRRQRHADRAASRAARRRRRAGHRRRPLIGRLVSRVRSSIDRKRLPRRLVVVALVITAILVWSDSDRSGVERGDGGEVGAVAVEPSGVTIPLARPDGSELVLAVDDDGVATLDASALPFLPEDFTYQVWGATADERVSLAVIGPRPGVESFHLPAAVGSLAITVEAEGGVAATSSPAVAFGTVPADG